MDDEFHSHITALQGSDSYWSINDQATESQREWPTFPKSHSCLVADPSTGCLASVWALCNMLNHPDDGSRPVIPVGGNTRSFDLFVCKSKVHHKCQWVWCAWCSLSCWLNETYKPICGILAFFAISNFIVPGDRISVLSYFWICTASESPPFIPPFCSLSVCLCNASVCEYRCVCPQKSVVDVGYLV